MQRHHCRCPAIMRESDSAAVEQQAHEDVATFRALVQSEKAILQGRGPCTRLMNSSCRCVNVCPQLTCLASIMMPNPSTDAGVESADVAKIKQLRAAQSLVSANQALGGACEWICMLFLSLLHTTGRHECGKQALSVAGLCPALSDTAMGLLLHRRQTRGLGAQITWRCDFKGQPFTHQ